MAVVANPDRVFSRTRFPRLKESLIEKYGANVGKQVYRAAAEIYANELEQMDDRGSLLGNGRAGDSWCNNISALGAGWC